MPRYGAPEQVPALTPLKAVTPDAMRAEVSGRLVDVRDYLRTLTRLWLREPFRYRAGETVRVECGTHRPPAGLLVVRALQADAPGTAPTCSAVPAWTWHQETGTVAISSISGLTSGTDYDVTLMVVE